MAAFNIRDFSGTVPRVSPKYLANNQAVEAQDVDLYAKSLRPMNAEQVRKKVVASPSGVEMRSLYYYDNKNFFTFWDETQAIGGVRDGDVDVVRSPLSNNTYERVYWTGFSYDEQRPAWIDNTCWATDAEKNDNQYPNKQWDLRVPRPTQTPTVAYPGAGSPSDPDNVEDRTYVWTWVRRYNGIEEESAPSDPSTAISVTPGDTVEVDLQGAGPALGYPLPAVRTPGTSVWTIYVYRTLTGVAGTEYQWVGEQSSWASDITFDDAVLAEDLGDIIRTTDFGEPDDDLRGLTSMPNGILAAFKKDTNEVHFCEPYQPHAWPVPYQLTTEYPIVAIGAFGESLCVATTDAPYVITGIHPSAMSMSKLELSQSCESKRSMVDMGQFVVYASPDGLVAVGSGMAQLITSEFFTKDDWQLLNPSSMHAVNWDDKYVCWYDAEPIGGSKGGFIFDPAEGGRTLTWLSEWFECAYSDTETDTVYVADLVPYYLIGETQVNTRVVCEWNTQQVDGIHEANQFPEWDSANFDVNLGGTISASGWDVDVTYSPLSELQWTTPSVDYESIYEISITVSQNSSDAELDIEFPNTLLWTSPGDNFHVPAGETGTYTFAVFADGTDWQFDYTIEWDDPSLNFEAEDAWVMWAYAPGATTGTVTISDVTITKLGPGDVSTTEQKAYLWKSKVFNAPKPMNVAAAQIQGSQTFTNPVKFTMWADGVKVFEKTINDERPFRCPSGYLAEEFQVQFEGTAEITDFYMATTMRELQTL